MSIEMIGKPLLLGKDITSADFKVDVAKYAEQAKAAQAKAEQSKLNQAKQEVTNASDTKKNDVASQSNDYQPDSILTSEDSNKPKKPSHSSSNKKAESPHKFGLNLGASVETLGNKKLLAKGEVVENLHQFEGGGYNSSIGVHYQYNDPKSQYVFRVEAGVGMNFNPIIYEKETRSPAKPVIGQIINDNSISQGFIRPYGEIGLGFKVDEKNTVSLIAGANVDKYDYNFSEKIYMGISDVEPDTQGVAGSQPKKAMMFDQVYKDEGTKTVVNPYVGVELEHNIDDKAAVFVNASYILPTNIESERFKVRSDTGLALNVGVRVSF